MKQKLLYLLRKAGLLGFAEQVRSYVNFIRSYRHLRMFAKEHPNFILPPWGIAYDAYAGLDPKAYLQLGEFHAKKIVSFIKKYKDHSAITVCDWGCGPMRVLRHLPELLGNKNSYLGLDYNPESIQWAQANFPHIHFKLNQLLPPLPLEDASFDVIYSISVFTHLSEDVFKAYVNDIYRVLKKGGMLITTLHGDRNSIRLMDFELEKYKKGEFVVRDNVQEGKRIFTSYHPNPFILNAFHQFTVLEQDVSNDDPNFQQDWWVFKK